MPVPWMLWVLDISMPFSDSGRHSWVVQWIQYDKVLSILGIYMAYIYIFFYFFDLRENIVLYTYIYIHILNYTYTPWSKYMAQSPKGM